LKRQHTEDVEEECSLTEEESHSNEQSSLEKQKLNQKPFLKQNNQVTKVLLKKEKQ
jgi:hypothetical protein